MERGNIEIKLANGKSLSTNNGEELFHFFNSDGKSIVAEPAKKENKKQQKK